MLGEWALTCTETTRQRKHLYLGPFLCKLKYYVKIIHFYYFLSPTSPAIRDIPPLGIGGVMKYLVSKTFEYLNTKFGYGLLEKKCECTTHVARRTTHDDGRHPIAIDHLSDSDELKKMRKRYSPVNSL